MKMTIFDMIKYHIYIDYIYIYRQFLQNSYIYFTIICYFGGNFKNDNNELLKIHKANYKIKAEQHGPLKRWDE